MENCIGGRADRKANVYGLLGQTDRTHILCSFCFRMPDTFFYASDLLKRWNHMEMPSIPGCVGVFSPCSFSGLSGHLQDQVQDLQKQTGECRWVETVAAHGLLT